MPAAHIDTTYSAMPTVATQKWTVASFVDHSLVWYRRGASQYTMPKTMNPTQPSAPPWTWAMFQSV
jgi:hypothetical protein